MLNCVQETFRQNSLILNIAVITDNPLLYVIIVNRINYIEHLKRNYIGDARGGGRRGDLCCEGALIAE